ncbi:MAG: hypothetical protein ISR65_06120 [Bacteriovoracaceae bacterium]|nr:hypothetical protein [Bacteriovoracaceae bacterium]
MDKQTIITCRSQGEAHLYVAVAKVDNKISTEEVANAYHYSRKCSSIIDLLKLDPDIKNTIAGDIKSILNDSKFQNWDSNNHLEEALRLFKKAKELGNYDINLIVEKHKIGLSILAQVDGYLYKESTFIKQMNELLGKL